MIMYVARLLGAHLGNKLPIDLEDKGFNSNFLRKNKS